jgi:hypothetical protein
MAGVRGDEGATLRSCRTHVIPILAKLGVGNRREAAAARLGLASARPHRH